MGQELDKQCRGEAQIKTQEALKKYFGYDSFRGGQEELISAMLSGQDALGIMPTGAGKSICFQLPAMLLSGITLVVSPLISLMKDQVRALTQSGIPAAYINSSLTAKQIETALYNAKIGKYKLIYVAPERLLASDFLAFAKSANIAMLTVDEAHCISQWGQDFRPSYAQIPQFISELASRPIVSAFTATATLRVRVDIVELLSLQNPTALVTGFDRENLYFEVQAPKNKLQTLVDFLHARQGKSGIVYCATRATVEDVCESLNQQGFSASRYHAGLSDSERNSNQDDFLFDRVQVMVATNAFGMGIDKSNVAFVVHYNMPKNIESYYQEAGRAGRDGSEADCLLLYSGQDVRTNQWMIEQSKGVAYPDRETEEVLKGRDRKRLREMTFFSTTSDCLRAFILKYFGETPPGFCGNCSNCNTKFETVDITEDAQKILSCVVRMKERFGATLVIDVLRGSKNERIRELGFDTLSTYGISDKSVHTLRAMIDYLLQNAYLDKSDGQYAVLCLGVKAKEVLSGAATIQMKLAKERIQSKNDTENARSNRKNTVPVEKEALYQKLWELRHELAQEQNVPAFVVFADRSLADMCIHLPRTPAQFLMVSGVGETKLQRYGERYLQLINDFCTENDDIKPEERSAQAGKNRKRKTAEFTLTVIPDRETLSKMQPSEQPVSISALTSSINEVLNSKGFSTLTAVRVAAWLVDVGYLQVVEQGDKRTKMPTSKGIGLGITKEERSSARGNYDINLYASDAQQFIIEHVCDIFA